MWVNLFVCAGAWSHTSGGQRSSISFLNYSSPLLFETGGLTNPKPHNTARLASQWTWGICPNLSHSSPPYHIPTLTSPLVMPTCVIDSGLNCFSHLGCWRYLLRSSFSKWDISLHHHCSFCLFLKTVNGKHISNMLPNSLYILFAKLPLQIFCLLFTDLFLNF